MQSIFYGMLVVSFNFSFNMGTVKIGLIPNFIGYILMIKGIEEICEKSKNFIRVKPYMKVMVGYTLYTYIIDLLGIGDQINKIVSVTLAGIFIIIALYISYSIIRGITDIEEGYNCDLRSKKLYSFWRISVVCIILVHIGIFIPSITFISIIIGFIINLCFLIEFNQSKNLYYE